MSAFSGFSHWNGIMFLPFGVLLGKFSIAIGDFITDKGAQFIEIEFFLEKYRKKHPIWAIFFLSFFLFFLSELVVDEEQNRYSESHNFNELTFDANASTMQHSSNCFCRILAVFHKQIFIS